ncbi:MAG: GPW/gp25 family protein [Chloroflexota bacterium]
MFKRLPDVLGTAIGFPLGLNDRNRLATVSGDAAVRQSIRMIIFTVPGERVMRPDFGCLIHDLIFDPANHETAITAQRYVRDALELWEPRIDLEEVQVEPVQTEADGGMLVINVVYKLKDQPDPRSMVFPYYLIPDGEAAEG